jgi:hypothetical protein
MLTAARAMVRRLTRCPPPGASAEDEKATQPGGEKVTRCSLKVYSFGRKTQLVW